MKRHNPMAALLTIAAVLATSMISCSNDDNLVENQQPKGVRTVHVTVGAGIDSGDETRSTFVQEDGKYKLRFTTGDRLYVWAPIRGTDSKKILAGYLNMVGAPDASGTSATFSGDLKVYLVESFSESEYDFTSDDYLSELDDSSPVSYMLVHNGSEPDILDDHSCFLGDITTTLNDLLTNRIRLFGRYDTDSKRINILTSFQAGAKDWCTPIFHVTVSGLTASAHYNIKFGWGEVTETNDGSLITDSPVQAGADGSMEFYFSLFQLADNGNQTYWLKFENNNTDIKYVVFGNKVLDSKIYNITRMATTSLN